MTPEQWAALQQQHGGVVGSVATDPLVTVPGTSVKRANPNPAYRYVFKDGTSITMRARGDGSGYDVTGDGGALKPAATQQPRAVSAPSSEQFIVVRNADGSIQQEPNPNYRAPAEATATPALREVGGQVYERDPKTGQWTPAKGLPATTQTTAGKPISAPGNEPYLLIQNADGSLSRVENPNYQPPKAAKSQDFSGLGLPGLKATGSTASERIQSLQDQLSNELGQIRQKLASGSIDVNTAVSMATNLHSEFSTQLAAEQDQANRALTQRGQDLSAGEGIANSTMGLMPSVMDHLAPAGTQEALNGMFTNLANGQPMGPVNLPSGQFPFDPNNLATQIAMHAVKHLSPIAAQMTGAPPPGSSGTMTLPTQQTQQQQQALPPPRFGGQPAGAAAGG